MFYIYVILIYFNLKTLKKSTSLKMKMLYVQRYVVLGVHAFNKKYIKQYIENM